MAGPPSQPPSILSGLRGIGEPLGGKEAHPADAQKLQEPYVTEWPARTQLLGGTTLRVLEAARVLRDMVPRLTGEMLPATVSMLQAIEAWQQAMFGGAHAVHDGTQTDADRPTARGKPSPTTTSIT